jgi:putative ABC transport system substrate-binding protein
MKQIRGLGARRRQLLLYCVQATALALCRPLAAQGRLARVGLLSAGRLEATERTYIEALREGLKRRGWKEGNNFVLAARYGNGDYARLPALAAELVAAKVDLIVATSTRAAFAVKDATTTIPTVFASVQDPVEEGLVASLSRPGANLTGIAVNSFAVLPKRLELLKEALPKLARVAMLFETDDASCQVSWERLTQSATTLGIAMQRVEIDASRDYRGAFVSIARGRAEAVIAPTNLLFIGDAPHIGALASRHHLPLVQQGAEDSDASSLFSYGPSLTDAFERAADYVDRILRGAQPATLPIEQSTRYELVLNMKVARALGITFPRAMLARADRVID